MRSLILAFAIFLAAAGTAQAQIGIYVVPQKPVYIVHQERVPVYVPAYRIAPIRRQYYPHLHQHHNHYHLHYRGHYHWYRR